MRVVQAARPHGHVQVLALCVERRTRQRQPVLEAVQTTDPERLERVHLQAMAITLRPGEPFFERRLQLAMCRTNHAVAVDVHQRAVQAVSATIGRTLHHAEVHGDMMCARNGADFGKIAAIDVDTLLEIPREDRLLLRVVEARAVGAFEPERIPWHECLAEADEVASFLCGQRDAIHDLGQRGVAMQPDRRDLRAPDDQSISGCGM